MNKRLLTAKRMLVLLAMGGTTFALFGTAFGAGGNFGCNYALQQDYQNLFTTLGDTFIEDVAGLAAGLGSDFDRYVLDPGTTFAQALWGNWVQAYVPNDVSQGPILVR